MQNKFKYFIIFFLFSPILCFSKEKIYCYLFNKNEKIFLTKLSDHEISMNAESGDEFILNNKNFGIIKDLDNKISYNSINNLDGILFLNFDVIDDRILSINLMVEKKYNIELKIPADNILADGHVFVVKLLSDLNIEKKTLEDKLISWVNNLSTENKLTLGIIMTTIGIEENILGGFFIIKGSAVTFLGSGATITIPLLGQIGGPVATLLGILETLVGYNLMKDGAIRIGMGINLIRFDAIDSNPLFPN